MLRRAGRLLSLAELSLDDDASIIDLDDPRTLVRERLRPSEVATRRRTVTQQYAARVYRQQTDVAALRWWSTIESSLLNLTIFDRGVDALAVVDAHGLEVDDDAVREAAEIVGLA